MASTASTGIDILHKGAHSASYFDLTRSMGEGVQIVDFCIPCNPYFPTPELFDELSRDLKNILKYYPSDSATITNKLASVLGLHPQTVAMANGSSSPLRDRDLQRGTVPDVPEEASAMAAATSDPRAGRKSCSPRRQWRLAR